MKLCPYCDTERPLSDFKPGRHKCKMCLTADKAAHSAAYREANKERKTAAEVAWREANKERVVARNAVYHATHKAAHPEKFTEKAARQRRTVAGQMPAWADREAILAVYRDAREFREAGVPATVDHIVPLRSELVCGLHCGANLTVKLKHHNDSKGNKFDPLTFDNRHPQGI